MWYRLLFLSLFVAVGCNSQKRNMLSKKPEKQNNISLKLGETKFVDAVQLNATFTKIITDSRCPQGANCIWQGVATVEISLMSTHSRPVTFVLSTNTVPGKSYAKSANFDGYTVSLEYLTPYPNAESSKINPKDYTVGLRFSKETAARRGEATTMPIEPPVSRAPEDTY